jgi:hypothetical protein
MSDMNTLYNGSDNSPLKTGGTRRSYNSKKTKKNKKGYRVCNTVYKAGV